MVPHDAQIQSKGKTITRKGYEDNPAVKVRLRSQRMLKTPLQHWMIAGALPQTGRHRATGPQLSPLSPMCQLWFLTCMHTGHAGRQARGRQPCHKKGV